MIFIHRNGWNRWLGVCLGLPASVLPLPSRVGLAAACKRIVAARWLRLGTAGLILLTLTAHSVRAVPVSQQRATRAIEHWLQSTPKPMGKAAGKSGKITTYANAAGELRFYVMDLQPTGYVVVSADDEVEPIIAFSHRDKFVGRSGELLFDLLQRDTEGRIRQLPTASTDPTRRTGSRAKWNRLAEPETPAAAPTSSTPAPVSAVNDPRVDPLVQSEWSQSVIYSASGSAIAVYNYYTPPYAAGNSNNDVAGCVATAEAQILRYHQWPKSGVGTNSFAISVSGKAQTQALLGGNGAGGPYDWADMVLVPPPGITTQQRQAIGALLHDAGLVNHMAYTASESGAWLSSAALRNVFHFANAADDAAGLSDILVAIRTNLDAGLPVALAISSPAGGHEIVCDGYGYNLGTLYDHLNLGWGGYDDTWYNLPNIGTSYGFNLVEECVCNVDPLVAGEIISGRVTDPNGNPLAGVTVAVAGSSVTTAVTNQRGIFAVKGLPSNTTLSVSRGGGGAVYGPVQVNVTTGQSSDNGPTGNRIVDDFQTTAPTAALQVKLLPVGAVTAGAQWRVDGGSWQNSGTTISGFAIGSHAVECKGVTGWITPASQLVALAGNSTASFEINYAAASTASLIAGSGVAGSKDGTGGGAQFNAPAGVAVDGAGNLYVADAKNIEVRKVTPGGIVTTLAGTAGRGGFANGTGGAAEFNYPLGVAVDSAGNVYVADASSCTIRKITAGGGVTTLAGTANVQGSADGSPGQFYYPTGVAVDGAGNVYVADRMNDTIRKVTAGGAVTTLAGSAGTPGSTDGAASAARFNNPAGIAVDGAGNVYVADMGNDTIRMITPGGVVATLAGSPGNAGCADGLGSLVEFNSPQGVAVDGAGNLYIADTGNGAIRQISPAGMVTTIAAAGSYNAPAGIAVDGGGMLYVADSGNNLLRKLVPGPAVPPTITSQPGAATTVMGGSATLAVAATATAPWAWFQWQMCAAGSSVWSNLADGGAFSGTATATLSIVGAGAGLNGAQFRCSIVDTSGSVVSAAATLTVSTAAAAPAFTTQPQSQTVAPACCATFTAAASGCPAPAYQWSVNGQPIAGATNASYTVACPKAASADSYTVVATNGAGSATSAAATLTVTAAVAPGFTHQPQSQSAALGASATFSAAASGSPLLTYQWCFNGTAIAGAIGQAYTVTNVQLSNCGNYTVVAANSAGSVTSSVATLSTPPTFSVQPQSVPANPGSNVTFTCAAGGSPAPTYQWYSSVILSVSGWFGTPIPGATSASCTISNVQASNGGAYAVIASNASGSISSSAAILTVAPAFTIQPQSQAVLPGLITRIVANAIGAPTPTYKWYLNGKAIAGATSPIYSIKSVTAADGGTYTVVATNSAGAIGSDAVNLTVAPKFTTQPQSNSAYTGASATFSAAANGAPAPTFQWCLNGKAISGATAASYSIPNVQTSSAGDYWVVATNSVGSATSYTGTLTVVQAVTPVFTTQPQARSVYTGTSTTFSSAAAGTPAPTFQWCLNGKAIAGATGTSYTIANVQTSSAGNYTVVATNPGGSTTSSTAALTVTQSVAPLFTTQPQGHSATVGSSTSFSAVASGTPVPAYQWSFNGKAISGATTASLTIPNVQLSSAGSYAVVATNSGGSATSSAATLTVWAAPTFTNQPQSRSVTAGSSTTFSAVATGTPAPAYQWCFNGKAIAGATAASYAISSVQTVSAGSYTVVATNSVSSVTSSAATLTVLVAPAFTTQPQSHSSSAGASTSFSSFATGTPAPTYQWRLNGKAITGATSAAYAIASAQLANAGSYTVVATNSAGSVTSAPAVLTLTSSGDAPPPGAVVAAEPGAQTGVPAVAPAVSQPSGPVGLYVFNTVAGMAAGSADGAGGAARFAAPQGVALDRAGNVFVADSDNDTVRKISPVGVVTTLAGSPGNAGSADGTGGAALFCGPSGVAVDGTGNVYVADTGNHTIRRISPAGLVTTLAGAAGQEGSADGKGGAALFSGPSGVAVDSAGNVYVADTGNSTVRKITSAGVVTTVAGAASQTGSADGRGAAAQFSGPSDVAVDSAGNVYVADTGNNSVRKITAAGVVTTLAGAASQAGSTDGGGGAALFSGPSGVAVDSAGNVYVADDGNNTVRKISPAGVVTTMAGTAGLMGSVDGPGGAALFSGPTAVAVDSAGNIYAADTGNNTIRRITPVGVVTTVAGTPSCGSVDGTGSAALFSSPSSVAVDGADNLYVADAGNDTIRKITPDGVVTTIAGAAGQTGSGDGPASVALFSSPSGVALDDAGNLYVADTDNNTIRKLTPAGLVTTVAGTAGRVGSADGAGTAAQFSGPSAVAVDGAGNLYVADTNNNTIRKLTPAGMVTTLAGTAGHSGSSDGMGPAAHFSGPSGLAVDSLGNVYIADTYNSTIRKITPAGVVTTFAGSAGRMGGADGTGSAASFFFPAGVAVDAVGNVYVADSGNDTIREITPGGTVTTLAGAAGCAGSADGAGRAALFSGPSGVAVDATGELFVADANNNTIRHGVLRAVAALAIGAQPQSMAITAGQPANFMVAATGAGTLSYQWQMQLPDSASWTALADAGNFSGSTTAVLAIAGATGELDGAQFRCMVSDATSSVASVPATLNVAGSAAFTIAAQPQSQTVNAGSAVAYAVTTTGAANPTFQWYLNGVALAGATGSLLVVPATPAMAGSYTCVVTDASGSVASNAASLTATATADPGRLINLSVNTVAGSASQLLSLGFVTGGPGTAGAQNLLVRAAGPALAAFGCTDALPDPRLTLFNSAGAAIAANAGWAGSPANQLAVTRADATTGAFALADPTSLDSATTVTLPANSGYTVQVDSVSGKTGRTLAEVYDATPPGSYAASSPRLINLSCRSAVAAGSSLTAGFTIGGSTARTVLIRASGPALAAFGVTGVMPDPQLQVYSAQQVIAANAGWGGDPAIAVVAQAVNAFAFTNPAGKDSAVVMTLPPGGYTLAVTSASGATGVTLIEVYEVP